MGEDEPHCNGDISAGTWRLSYEPCWYWRERLLDRETSKLFRVNGVISLTEEKWRPILPEQSQWKGYGSTWNH